MEALECIKTRRSVRKFKEDIIPDEVIRELVELASYSPSWKNTQTIRYISVSDPEKIKKIAEEGVMGFALNEKTVSRAHQLMVVTQKNGICGYERDGSFSTSKGAGWEMFDAGIAAQPGKGTANLAGRGDHRRLVGKLVANVDIKRLIVPAELPAGRNIELIKMHCIGVKFNR